MNREPSTKNQRGFTLISAGRLPIQSGWRSSEMRVQPQRGFTLIELLVVIVIISILITLASVSYSAAQLRGRDSKRKSDIAALRNSLELYFNDIGIYPTSLSPLSPTYINPLPTDPKDLTNYNYLQATTTYTLWACLENVNDAEKDGPDGSGTDRCGVVGTPDGRVSYTKINP